MSLESPENAEEAIAYAKMLIGEPVVRVNVTDVQCRLVLRKCLTTYLDYMDASTEESIVTIEVQQDDIDKGYFVLPEQIKYVMEVYGTRHKHFEYAIPTYGPAFGYMTPYGGNFAIPGFDFISLYLAQRESSYIEKILNPPPEWTYNHRTNRLRLIVPKDHLQVGQEVAIRARVSIEDMPGVFWSNTGFLDLLAASIKKQWADNLTKYNDIALPGGHTLNARGIADAANQELDSINEKIKDDASVLFPVISIG